MRTAFFYLQIGLALLLSTDAVAQNISVRGDPYVAQYFRSAPKGMTLRQWIAKGNANPAVRMRGAGVGGGISGESFIFGPGAETVAPPPPDAEANPSEASTDQPVPSVIILEPQQPRPPRIITTNDLPRWTFGGEAFDERAAARSYQSQQAAKGNPEALYAMGIRFLRGIDVSKNEVLARDFLEAAKKKGNLRARAKLEELARTKREAEANPPTRVFE
jgi:hypothetical protein